MSSALRKSRAVCTEIFWERKRQVREEGWTAEHDEQHYDGALANAAACYALSSSGEADYLRISSLRLWPWAREWWKPKDRRRDLVRAAALIVAEIERLDRTKMGES